MQVNWSQAAFLLCRIKKNLRGTSPRHALHVQRDIEAHSRNHCCRVKNNNYRGADKYLARPGRKQARKHVRDTRDFNNIETRAVIKFFFPALQGKAPKEFTPF